MKIYLSNFVLKYLRFFARLQINKIKFLQKIKHRQLDIVGITGSSGKSSTLFACQSVFGHNLKIKTNNGYNSESGLPLSILNLKIKNYNFLSWVSVLFFSPIKYLTDWHSYDILILEMGIDSSSWPKNMDYLLSIVKPNIGIFLNVGHVHLESFSSQDQIAQEKSKLINQAKVAIINPYDKLVKKYTQNKNILSISPTAIKFDNLFLPSIYQISFGAALELAKLFNISYSIAIKNIQNNFSLPPSRSSILRGIKNTTIIDSSYNSSPLACQELLTFLSTYKTKKIAVLGDMRELGEASAIQHQNIFKIAQKSSDIIISIGPETKKYFINSKQEIKDDLLKIYHFNYWWQASVCLKNIIKGGETILVKGSQNTLYLEELVKEILQDPLDATKVCRQSHWWLKKKENFKKENQTTTP